MERSPLLTDFYQLTMAQGYWQLQRAETEAVFELTFRRPPFNSNFAVSAGLGNVIDYLQHYLFSSEDLAYLSSLRYSNQTAIFSEGFLNYLADLKFSCDVDAIPEGEVVFANEPLLRVQGPLLQCQLLETILLNLVNFSTLIATRSAQICTIANEDPVMEFGLRRAQGPDGGLTATRAAYIGGCESSSNVLAGKLFDVPVKGTMAHSWVMSYPDELTAFREFVKTSAVTILLVDTYDTLQGVKHAIQVGHELRQAGRDLMAVRLDSGDLLDLSRKTRQLLDDARLRSTQIIASGNLTLEMIQQLKAAQAPINIWGIGTKLVTAYEQPALDGIYKLTAIKSSDGVWEYKSKTSDSIEKRTFGGIHQVRRYYGQSKMLQDIIYDIHQTHLSASSIKFDSEQDLLVPIFRKGHLVYQQPGLKNIREYCQHQVKLFLQSFEQENEYQVLRA